MLGDRRDLVWDAEPFEPRRRAKVPEAQLGLSSEEVLRRRRSDRAGYGYVFAFKYLQAQHRGVLGLDFTQMFSLFDRVGVDHFVAIRRRNHLRRFVSAEVGRRRGSYHQRHEDGAADLVTVRLEPKAVRLGVEVRPLVVAFEELDREERQLAEALRGRKHVWIDFEDHIEQDPTVAYERVCAFAGLPAVDVDVRLARTTDFPLDQVIENYDEVVATLQGTRFAWMLDG